MAADQSDPITSPHQHPFRLGWLLAGISPELASQDQLCLWPPDVFALVAATMETTGCYVPYLRRLNSARRRDLAERSVSLGARWRQCQTPKDIPRELQAAWASLRAQRDVSLHDATDKHEIQEALHLLLAAADEASEGLGYKAVGHADRYHGFAQLCLRREQSLGSTLCSARISPAVARVLPKMHTPQGGLSLRSLSRNLALFPGTAIRPFWFNVESEKRMTSFNLLIVPWPENVTPNQFREINRDSAPGGQAANGYFAYSVPGDPKDSESRFRNLLARAKNIVDRIDGVVFPEVALRKACYQRVLDEVRRDHCFLIAGVGEPSQLGSSMENSLYCDYPYHGTRVPWSRGKHHRWRLDRSQILQYGLGGALHTQVRWWEKIPLGERTMGFFSLSPRFTMCSLICEDLAQQDPLGYLMRSVGPNLVVALLMDGPQISQRWSSRYASVLADDPGSSVLTLTSLGMSSLCRPHGLASKRVVALWKDARSGSPVEIELPPQCDGAILHVSVETAVESTADGRVGEAAFPILAGVHFVRREKES